MTIKLIGVDDATGEAGTTALNYLNCQRFQAVATGTLTEFKIKLNAGLTVNAKLAIYADSSGAPGSALWRQNTGQGLVAGWNTITVSPGVSITSGNYYWLGFILDATKTTNNYSNVAGTLKYKSQSYSGGCPDPAGTGFSDASVTRFLAGWGTLAIVVPVALTQEATNVTSEAARLNGIIDDDGEDTCEARFRYRKTGGIDVGSDATDRSGYCDYGLTWIDLTNSANASGVIDTIEVWAVSGYDITGLVVGTFYLVGGTTYKCRDSVAIGSVTAGSKQTFEDLDLEVQAGDFLGCYYTGGRLEAGSGGSGIMYAAGEHIDPDDETSYTLVSDQAQSLYGMGGIAWTVTDWQNTLETDSEYYEDISSLDASTEYEFQTQAKNGAGEGDWSISDTFETLSALVAEFIGQTVRQITELASFEGQTSRIIQKLIQYIGQTKRIVTKIAGYTGQDIRIIQSAASYSAQTLRQIQNVAEYIGQGLRALATACSYNAQTARIITALASYTGQAFRVIKNLAECVGQTFRKVLLALTAEKRYEYYNTGDNTENTLVEDDYLIAQTFIPTISHTITSVKLKLQGSGGEGSTFVICIRATGEDGKPTGEDLCATIVHHDELAVDPDFDWYEAEFDSSYPLLEDVSYALVIRGNIGGLVKWRFNTEGSYEGGCGYASPNGGLNWEQNEEYDYMFEEWGEGLAPRFQTQRIVTELAGYIGQGLRQVVKLTEYIGQTQRLLKALTTYSGQTQRVITILTQYAGQTLREVTSLASYSAQTVRNVIVGIAAEFIGQTVRRVIKTTTFEGQTQRVLTSLAAFEGQTVRNIVLSVSYVAQTFRQIIKVTTFQGQTKRILTSLTIFTGQTKRITTRLASYSGQTYRIVKSLVSYAGQTIRDIAALASFAGQAYRQIKALTSYTGQTKRILTTLATFEGQAERVIIRLTSYSGQAYRAIRNLAGFSGQTIRQIKSLASYAGQGIRAIKSLTSYIGQTKRIVTHLAQYQAQTMRNVLYWFVAIYYAQTRRIVKAVITFEGQTKRIITLPAGYIGQTFRRVVWLASYSGQTQRIVKSLAEFWGQTKRIIQIIRRRGWLPPRSKPRFERSNIQEAGRRNIASSSRGNIPSSSRNNTTSSKR
jgi:uncharacterized protein YigE (DUF2233 family)